MSSDELPAIAIVADAHFHDIESDYDGAATTIDGKRLVLRSWRDTRISSRVFNESGLALRTALSQIAQDGIRHVVLLGDYTDDGQVEATERVVELLHHYQNQFDMAFYATPGNHDVYGPVGKHQSTRFVSAPGKTVLVTSDASVAASERRSAVLTDKMYCKGTPDGLQPMAQFGFFRQPGYVHWETPFGLNDSVESRLYEAQSADKKISRQLMDASYLVEPVEGLWLLMIDANVFEPRNGQHDMSRKKAFFDSSNAGWNSVIRIKPFLIDWINDVCSRASQLGKSLSAFSHYPAMDPFDDHCNLEFKLFGYNANVRRRPVTSVAESLASAGLRLHFSGHLHVNGTSEFTTDKGKLTNIAVPSLVAFPACYKILYPGMKNCRIDSVSLTSMRVDSLLMDTYRAELHACGEKPDPALNATNYGEFLYQRMYSRVLHNSLPKQWPTEIANQIPRTSALDLACLLLKQRDETQAMTFGSLSTKADTTLTRSLQSIAIQHDITLDNLSNCLMMTLIADWYCLRQAGGMPTGFITAEQLRVYAFLQQEFGDTSLLAADTDAAFLSIFVSMFVITEAQGERGLQDEQRPAQSETIVV